MLTAATDNSLQGKWASMWFMQEAQKAVQTEDAAGERLWPLHTASTHKSDPREAATASIAQSSLEDTVADEIDERSEQKRSPRGVLAVLKSRLRQRAMGQ